MLRQPQPVRRTPAGNRGLYDSLGGRSDTKQAQLAMLWVLNLSDGEHSLVQIAERARLPFGAISLQRMLYATRDFEGVNG